MNELNLMVRLLILQVREEFVRTHIFCNAAVTGAELFFFYSEEDIRPQNLVTVYLVCDIGQ